MDPDPAPGLLGKRLSLSIVLRIILSYIGGINAIYEAGLRVPEDISIAGYDGIGLPPVVSPRLTTWHQNTEALGRIAARKLIERIEHPRSAVPEQIIVHGELLEGETIRQLD